MSFGRSVRRKARGFVAKLRHAPTMTSEDGQVIPQPFASHVAQIAELRVMDIPPAAPGSADSGERDRVDDPTYNARLNAKKRARRERRRAS